MAGNKNSGKRKDKLFYTALVMEMNDAPDLRGARAIARRLLKIATDESEASTTALAAIREIANRLDGTPAQTVDMNVTDHRSVEELSDAELLAIAAGSRNGDTEAAYGPEEPDRLH